ncbi:hypothetical protein [Streptomyces sp. KL2]|uniref:hypothetical protein n=1 Tax=Streptomyces sp. KL2 TaxID=3050126 RepID=UPI00397D6CF1
MISTMLWPLAIPAAFAVGVGIWNALFPSAGGRDLWLEQERHRALQTVVTGRTRYGQNAAPPRAAEWRIAA